MSEMSSFWSGWIIVLTVGNVVACFWLVWWTMRKRPETKYQNPSEQIRVRKDDRLRVIKMEAEKE